MEAKNNKNNGMNVIENVENEMQVTEESRRHTADHPLTRRKDGSWITLSLSTSTMMLTS